MARRIFVDPEFVVAPKRHRTHDLMGPSKHSAVFASEQIGLKRYKTPAGFLFCEDVPIARIGEMIYGVGEVPVEAEPGNPYIRVSRDADALFKLETLLSFQGADITNDHPPEDVDPKNWRGVTVGHIMNPRRGEGPDADVIVADFLIKDARAIKDVEDGKVEVSCGYDAEYHQTRPGFGYQSNIIGNHVALVERGRCGPRCAIGDRQPEEEDEMKFRDNATATTVAPQPTDSAARIRRHFHDAAEAAVKDLDAGGGTNVHVHIGGAANDGKTHDAVAAGATTPVTTAQLATVVDSIAALTKTVAKLVKGRARDADKEKTDDEEEEEEDKEKMKNKTDDGEEEEDDKEKEKTKDSRALETAFKDTLSGVEVLAPGLKLPTFDAKVKRADTVDSLCRMRSRALDRYSMTPQGGAILAKLLDGKTYDSVSLDCKGTAQLFKSAVVVQKTSNNTASVGDRAFTTPQSAGAGNYAVNGGVGGNYRPGVVSAEQINERHKKHWEGQGVK